MGVFQEFREFAIKGSVVDLAVGVVIGAAFNQIVNLAVNDILSPPLGLLLGGIDFSDFYINLSGGRFETLALAREAGAVTLNYGLFVNTAIGFVVTAWVVFLFVRTINRMRRLREEKKEAVAPTHKMCPFCISEIPRKATRCPECTSALE